MGCKLIIKYSIDQHLFFVKKYIESTSNLITLYEDHDGLRKKEIQLLSGPNEYSEFNSRLKSIISYHKKTNLSDMANV